MTTFIKRIITEAEAADAQWTWTWQPWHPKYQWLLTTRRTITKGKRKGKTNIGCWLLTIPLKHELCKAFPSITPPDITAADTLQAMEAHKQRKQQAAISRQRCKVNALLAKPSVIDVPQ
jgi:3'-phosphoadenosine 5'-phosphosulfate sulfotransferase (PAPS reductase)/FAD synthetase